MLGQMVQKGKYNNEFVEINLLDLLSKVSDFSNIKLEITVDVPKNRYKYYSNKSYFPIYLEGLKTNLKAYRTKISVNDEKAVLFLDLKVKLDLVNIT